MDYLRCGGSHALIGIRGPREDTVEVKDDGVLQEHFWMTNPGVHFVLKISQYILLSFLEVTVSYGQLAFSSGFFSLVYWDHDGDDILQGNHITVGQRRKKETGRKVRGIDIDQEEDSLFLLCCLM
ncbi:hypothetical protein OsJ_21609 [Oryza sativa Japonica Group]|uniref:Uncharacterized protein n=1 Tax=Oryza sativa subsp. japonica TaxID=39947 RepID=B9FTN0_ORYSJ|nr:hypothetical protein OsJ_21609 [Oryza sativa Japonica Group]